MADRTPRRGEIWYAFTPGQPDDPHQPRPVLVISENIRNRHADDVVVVPIFSSGRPSPTRVHLPAKVGGLSHASIAFCEEITTLDDDFFEKGPLGPLLPKSILDAVVAAILIAIGG